MSITPYRFEVRVISTSTDRGTNPAENKRPCMYRCRFMRIRQVRGRTSALHGCDALWEATSLDGVTDTVGGSQSAPFGPEKRMERHELSDPKRHGGSEGPPVSNSAHSSRSP